MMILYQLNLLGANEQDDGQSSRLTLEMPTYSHHALEGHGRINSQHMHYLDKTKLVYCSLLDY